MLIALFPPKSKAIARCCNCLEVGAIACYRAKDNLPLCEKCAKRANPVLLEPIEWMVYQSLETLKKQPNYLSQTAKNLNISYSKVKAIALRLERLGLKIRFEGNPKYTVTNSKGEPVVLTQKQYMVWAIATDKKYLIQEKYLQKGSEELGMKYHYFVRYVNILRSKGIDILTAHQRKQNFKDYVLNKIKTSALCRSSLIKRISSETGYSRCAVNRIVMEHETNGVKVSEGSFWEEVLEVLRNSQEISIPDLQKYFPSRRQETIRWAVNRLKDKRLVNVRRELNRVFVSVKEVA